LEGDGNSLSGCIDRNGHLGKIDITPFEVTIKGLDCDFDFQHQYKQAEWENLIGFLQYKAILNPQDPVQLVDRVIGHFKKFLEKPKKQQGVSFSLQHLISPMYKLKSDC